MEPDAYIRNAAFLVKVALVGLGIVNALILRSSHHWRRVLESGEVRITVKASAALSLIMWTSAIVAGRGIAFLQ